MSKLVKQKYTTADGDRRVFSYLATVPKKVVKASNINEDDEIIVTEYEGNILIQKKDKNGDCDDYKKQRIEKNA